MARKNPNPLHTHALATVPDGRYVAVSERLVGVGAGARPARVGTAYLEKSAAGFTYTNRRGETQEIPSTEWLRRYNDVFFNPVATPGPRAGRHRIIETTTVTTQGRVTITLRVRS